ncbi:TauD/TfdA family dioxygenase [Streptomyces sp. NPDC046909]|uniref:TauD/TfdA family dioxygenase n=1 Tax=Streptomyces sp. NPDC046909 TaxID=3155617 RepID=UPI0033EAC000
MTVTDSLTWTLPQPTADLSRWRTFGCALASLLETAGDDGHVVLPGLLAPQLPGEDTPTPPDWQHAGTATARLDRVLQLLGESLGAVLTWKNQQDGAAVHNIVPTAGAERLQIGAGSTSELVLHTEDAFHPDRADLVILACVRNPDRVPTRLASVRHVSLAEEHWRQLGRRRVAISVDSSYGDDPAGTGPPPTTRHTVATVWRRGDTAALRFDPAYSRLPDDPAFREAYAALEAGLAAVREDVVLEPGDLLILDNNTVVHGRSPFVPRYNGNDRWLKRVLVGTGVERHPAERWEPAHEQTPVVAARTRDVPWTF